MSNFSKLKRVSREDSLAQLKTETEALDSKQQYKDDRYWYPVTDNNGVGSAVIRFLPGIFIEGTDQQEPNFVRKFYHSFKNPKNNLWYIENSLLSIGQKDPCVEYNSMLWNTEDPDKRKQASRQKKKTGYISNIYVIKHPGRPDDEGKVFLYQYGQKIMDKIKEKAFPPEEEPDLERVNVFSLTEGANFRLRIKKVDGFRNYDSSVFDAPRPLFDSDEELAAVFDQEYSVKAEVSMDKFKSYAELQRRLSEVLGHDIDGVVHEDEEVAPPPRSERKLPESTRVTAKATEADLPWDEEGEEDAPVRQKVAPAATTTAPKATDSDFFNKLKLQAAKKKN